MSKGTVMEGFRFRKFYTITYPITYPIIYPFTQPLSSFKIERRTHKMIRKRGFCLANLHHHYFPKNSGIFRNLERMFST